jgi:alkylhydroperoxidase family enzyme
MDWMHGRSRPTIPTANARLAWTEAVTNLRDGRVPDEAYEKVRTVFTEKELAYQAQKRELKQGA